MTSHPLALVWHRRDLRVGDHRVIQRLHQHTAKIVGVFCLDPALLNPQDVAPARVAYLLGCLRALKQDYHTLGSDLLLFRGNPIAVIPAIAQGLNAQWVGWSLDTEPYAQDRDLKVAQALRDRAIAVVTEWDQLLHHPGEVLTQGKKPYTVYGPFWKNWSKLPKPAIVETPKELIGLTDSEHTTVQTATFPPQPIPTLTELAMVWDAPLPLAPGAAPALARLDQFINESLSQYDHQRNFPAQDGTSQLSAALKFGVVSIRTLWQASQEALDFARSEEERANIQTWQQELAWREFYQHCLYAFPQLVDGPYRQPFHHFPWEDNEAHFQAWCEGGTGYPIIDAAMAQLNQTGWMHNRCRMIVASFLTKDLILNWQKGERYFMQTLYDGDLAANNGGWQWSASSGMDPKPLRIFNPYTQAQKFDPDGDYIRTWLPQLARFETADLLTGKLTSLERRSVNYPDPIVDHNHQQREFKRRYQQATQTLS